MAENTNTEREALLELIDAYAEARHIGGCHTYNAKTAEARAKVVASLSLPAAGQEPVADTYKIKIIKTDTGEVVKTFEAATERAANRIDDGLNINMNHADYYTVIEPPASTEG